MRRRDRTPNPPPERGIAGNGHMPMCEDNSDEIAALIVAWLEAKGL